LNPLDDLALNENDGRVMSGRQSWKEKGFLASLRSGDVAAVLTRHADLVLAAVVVLCVGMLILPLPTLALDLLISLNLAAAVTLLLVVLYVGDALRIATFPTLLLLTTLFRLAIEVSATRLILLNANAGQVIAAFGGFVVAGNLVVGMVVFVILTVIQYVVIAKGAARVAEVGARFTLDAMPGKQMAIDAELRAGYLDHAQATERRATLARESQFFGSMDGAMRFVRGDAVAGIVILLINLGAGLLIGVLQKGMDFGQAVRTYTLLTVGEGLVAQIPALIIATAAGILVTRVSSEEEGAHLGRDIGRQILAQPKALAITAALLVVLAAVPGLPALPFLILAALLGLLAYRLPGKPAAHAGERVRPTESRPLLDPLAVELSPALAATLLPARGRSRLADELLPALRERCFAETGIPVPVISVHGPVAGLEADAYVIRLHEIPVARGRASAGSSGTAPDPALAIVEHVHRVLRRHGYRLVGIEETQRLLDSLSRTHPALVREVVPAHVTTAVLADVLQRLAREGISLRHLGEILGAVAKHAPGENEPAVLAERVRAALQRQMTFQYAANDGAVGVYLVDSSIEEVVREAIRDGATGSHLALEPGLAQDIVAAVGRAVAGVTQPVILTSAAIRRHLRELLEPEHPEVAVLAYPELLPEARLDTLGYITVATVGETPAAAPGPLPP
jgi:type III secretion protein V